MMKKKVMVNIVLVIFLVFEVFLLVSTTPRTSSIFLCSMKNIPMTNDQYSEEIYGRLNIDRFPKVYDDLYIENNTPFYEVPSGYTSSRQYLKCDYAYFNVTNKNYVNDSGCDNIEYDGYKSWIDMPVFISDEYRDEIAANSYMEEALINAVVNVTDQVINITDKVYNYSDEYCTVSVDVGNNITNPSNMSELDSNCYTVVGADSGVNDRISRFYVTYDLIKMGLNPWFIRKIKINMRIKGDFNISVVDQDNKRAWSVIGQGADSEKPYIFRGKRYNSSRRSFVIPADFQIKKAIVDSELDSIWQREDYYGLEEPHFRLYTTPQFLTCYGTVSLDYGVEDFTAFERFKLKFSILSKQTVPPPNISIDWLSITVTYEERVPGNHGTFFTISTKNSQLIPNQYSSAMLEEINRDYIGSVYDVDKRAYVSTSYPARFQFVEIDNVTLSYDYYLPSNQQIPDSSADFYFDAYAIFETNDSTYSHLIYIMTYTTEVPIPGSFAIPVGDYIMVGDQAEPSFDQWVSESINIYQRYETIRQTWIDNGFYTFFGMDVPPIVELKKLSTRNIFTIEGKEYGPPGSQRYRGSTGIVMYQKSIGRGFNYVSIDNFCINITGKEKRPLVDMSNILGKYYPEPVNISFNGYYFNDFDFDEYGNPYFIYNLSSIKNKEAFTPVLDRNYYYLKNAKIISYESVSLDGFIEPNIYTLNITAPEDYHWYINSIILSDVDEKPAFILLRENNASHLIPEGQWEYDSDLKTILINKKGFIADVFSGSGSAKEIEIKMYYARLNLYFNIIDEDGEPFKDVFVQIEHEDTRLKYQGVSDESGHVDMKGIIAGRYYIKLSFLESFSESAITITTGTYAAELQFITTWDDLMNIASRLFNVPVELIYSALAFLVVGTAITVFYNGGYQLLYKNIVKITRKKRGKRFIS